MQKQLETPLFYIKSYFTYTEKHDIEYKVLNNDAKS